MFNPGQILSKIFKNPNQKELEKLKYLVTKINDFEFTIKKLPDDHFPKKTQEFKSKIKGGADLMELLPESFAYVREAARRTLNERHYDVQLIGGIVLHQGKIAEMKTGEGKTLASTLPVYLNALKSKGVHIVTVNEYLAKRDSEWMGKIYKFMGMTVGCITNDLDDHERRKNYLCDATYGTNSEFGFDYLRDNMKYSIKEVVQRNHDYCIVDEVDSILIDEARTPLVISGSVEDKSDQYLVCDKLVKSLDNKDYELDEKNNNALLSNKGIDKIEKILSSNRTLKNNNFYDPENITLVHHVNQALKANFLFSKDKDYIVKDDKIKIIDEFTGRILEGRRFSDGLHQALEAKEKVEIENENQTLASITYQNYFRLYEKLSGMTGTAITEAEEFFDIYNLSTISIPTNKDMIRVDSNDQIFRTEVEKRNAIINKIIECKKNGRPALVGTTSIEKSEEISKILTKRNITHNVLNAKNHEREAKIIAGAGKLNALTIATNMAGRGTDIQLGGNTGFALSLIENKTNENIEDSLSKISKEKKEVIDKEGLFVIGTERHESRRIDNQLRGRSGRQGDPGQSIFYVSLEDDLMRIFGSESLDGMLKKLGLKENESINHPWIDKALERAQQKVEGRNFDIRKTLLKFDDVMNDQRHVIFGQRKKILSSENITQILDEFLVDLIEYFKAEKLNAKKTNSTEHLKNKINTILGRSINEEDLNNLISLERKDFDDYIKNKFHLFRNERIKTISEKINNDLEKRIFLQTLDLLWRSHLQYLEQLRQVIGLRSYGQKDPLNEFKREAFVLFENLLNKIKIDIFTFLNNLTVEKNSIKNEEEKLPNKAENLPVEEKPSACLLIIKKGEKISRNERCEATGKKFKNCCGKL